MPMVDLHPHFVSARNYEDVKTVVGLLKEAIDDDDFVQPDSAPFLPPTYTSTIHINDTVSTFPSLRNTARADSGSAKNRSRSARSASPMTTSASPVSAQSAPSGTANALHAPSAEEEGTSSSHSPIRNAVDEPLIFPSQSPLSRLSAPPASTTEFLIRRRASSHNRLQAGAKHPKVLCIWDVDDTLVASGVSGVRQNLVFRESELVSLFRSAGPNARHVLLSQGSIDDIFTRPGGRLRCIQKYVQPNHAAPRREASGGGGGTASSSASSAAGHAPKKHGSSLSGIFTCGSSQRPKEPSPTSRRPRVSGGGGGSGRTDESDMRHFAPGTVVVRLSSVYDRAEKEEDALFLTHTSKAPTCGRPVDDNMEEKKERMGRWLILRPEVWGITLASMSTMFPASRFTASVNGKVYRKMDVVWSLAMTGEWDSVFFIDNNLSEVGVVRNGMQMSDVLNLRSGLKIWRFFQAEFLLMVASAKLREMNVFYGRDITKPPPPPAASVSGAAAAAKEEGHKESKESANAQAATAEKSVEEVGGQLTPSKSTATSSSDSAGRGTGGGGDRAAVDGTPSVEEMEGEKGASLNTPRRHSHHKDPLTEDVQIIDPPSALNLQRHGLARPPSADKSDTLSLNSSSRRQPSCTSPTTWPSPPSSPTGFCKDVDLVVVNLHMSCDVYQRVLTRARTNDEGQRSMQRDVSDMAKRYVGQPVFSGDRSCTDEQYEAVLRYFQETESGLIQWIEEELRVNGFVDVRASRRWVPGPHVVHAPMLRRPRFIPHLANYYLPLFDEIEEQLLQGIRKYGGTSASCTLHTVAQQEYFTLQRVVPFIDPYLTGDLGRALFDTYIRDGNIPRSMEDQLRKVLNHVRGRLLEGHSRKR